MSEFCECEYCLSQCRKRPQSEWCPADNDEHGCPYQADVNDDNEFACRCCACRTQECAWDI